MPRCCRKRARFSKCDCLRAADPLGWRYPLVDIDSLELQVAGTLVGTAWVDSMLVGEDLPELGTDLVTTLTGL